MGVVGTNGFINWESESYPEAIDFSAVPFFALFFPSVRLFLDTYVFEKLARRLIFGKASTSTDVATHENRKKINKFKESAWKYIYFSSAEILALSVSYNEPWFTNTKYFWVGPEDQIWPDQKLKLKLKGHYMFVAGFYIYSIFALIFWETRRSDFAVSMAHHVATVILLVMSYILRFARVGSNVLALHDVCDGFLEIAKMSRYSGYEWISSIFFVLFVLSWTIFRIIYYPFWILRSTSYEVVLTLDMKKHMVDGPLNYYLFNTLLFCILVFNIYWWILMVRMVVEQIKARGKVSDDVRSDSEGEDEHDD
ncbi:ceramide synthase 1 LOH3 [Ricinus communis]|uniref:ceramide synthase 1 LOH3 n=1 Tax=Ricinus communis TaxID=3988 RepID=UPI00201AB520|nr:ceramide synthase 1 LOH3 [Ricinus communis]XP_048235750.1 ceramide synthase 1 LOH3 [Ricinus communis]